MSKRKTYSAEITLTEKQLVALAAILDSFMDGRASHDFDDNSLTYRDADRIAPALMKKVGLAEQRIARIKRVDGTLARARAYFFTNRAGGAE